MLYVPVLTGCSSSRSVQQGCANGTFFGSVTGGAQSISVTPAHTGSLLFGFLSPYEATIFADWSANSGSQILVGDSSLGLYRSYAFWIDSTSVTTAGTPQAVGMTYSSTSATNFPMIAQEIAASGTLAIDASTPAEVIGTTPPSAPVITTASFTPPVGAVLLAIVAGGTATPGGPITGYRLTDSANKYQWTPLVSFYAQSNGGYAAPAMFLGTVRPPIAVKRNSAVPVYSATF